MPCCALWLCVTRVVPRLWRVLRWMAPQVLDAAGVAGSVTVAAVIAHLPRGFICFASVAMARCLAGDGFFVGCCCILHRRATTPPYRHPTLLPAVDRITLCGSCMAHA